VGGVADKAPVRTTRSRILYLRNDHKALMTVIEKHLHEHFAKLAEQGQQDEPMTYGGPSSIDIPSSSSQAPQPSGPPFAKVNSVVAGSPAESAGLKAGDEIRNFGYVNHTNHDGLKRVGECVQGNEGVSKLLSRANRVLIIYSEMFSLRFLDLRVVVNAGKNYS